MSCRVVEQPPHGRALLVDGRLAGVGVDPPRLPAAHALGLVERRVGEVEQARGRVRVGRPRRDARRAVQREAVDRQPADQRAGALGDAERLVGVHVGQQDPELLAAQAADEVVRAAHRLAQLGGHLAQHLVAVRVPAGVVEELEVVEVEHDDGGRARRADRVLERLVEAAVVGQPGQRVALGERLQAVALRLHERRHVVEAADQRADLAGAGRRHARGVVAALDAAASRRAGSRPAARRSGAAAWRARASARRRSARRRRRRAAGWRPSRRRRASVATRPARASASRRRASAATRSPTVPCGDGDLRAVDRLEAHEHAGRRARPRRAARGRSRGPTTSARPSGSTSTASTNGSSCRERAGPGHRLARCAAPARAARARTGAAPTPAARRRPAPPPSSIAAASVSRSRRENAISRSSSARPVPRAGVVAELGDLGASAAARSRRARPRRDAARSRPAPRSSRSTAERATTAAPTAASATTSASASANGTSACARRGNEAPGVAVGEAGARRPSRMFTASAAHERTR